MHKVAVVKVRNIWDYNGEDLLSSVVDSITEWEEVDESEFTLLHELHGKCDPADEDARMYVLELSSKEAIKLTISEYLKHLKEAEEKKKQRAAIQAVKKKEREKRQLEKKLAQEKELFDRLAKKFQNESEVSK